MTDLCIRKANARDLDAIKALADANKGTLGFVLRPVLAEGIARSWILVAESSVLAFIGFVHYRHRQDSQTTIYEICVQAEHRDNGVGRSMIGTLTKESIALSKTHIRLKAPVDIPANAFYQAMGFTLARTEPGRRCSLNVWDYDLHWSNPSL